MSKITLLNGEAWDMASLLHEMHDDDFYYGHLGQYALSSTSCKMLLDSPKSYYFKMRYGSGDSAALNIGRITHMMALEPHRFEEFYEVVPVKSRNTKMFKEHITHLTKITQTEYSEADRLASALLRNEQVLGLLQGCEFEVPQAGMIDGLPFRSKADIYKAKQGIVMDLKTTTNLKAFKVSADKYSYDMQCYLYCKLFNADWRKFKFIAIDKQSCDIGIYEVSETFVARGKKKLDRAIEIYKDFFIKGEDMDSYTIRDTLE